MLSLFVWGKVVWPCEIKKIHMHFYTRGSIETPKLLPLSSVSVVSFGFFLQSASMLLTISTIELVFNHLSFAHAILVHNIDPVFYHYFTVHTRNVYMYL